MGVHGLWKLLESTGKPINPETLEGKILAVDISIWLNQAVKGVRDRDGNSVQNAHLLTLFNRLCKLLFFRIRPVFVYDGDAPILKKQTLAIRRQRKEEITRESKQTNEKLLRTFLKRQAIKAALGDNSQAAIPSISSVRKDEEDDLYVLPALPPAEEKEGSSSDEEMDREGGEEMPEAYLRLQEDFYADPNSVDINSEEFSLLSPEIKHEILKEMKEFSKRRRTMYHKPPERSKDFSQYQLAGLLQRNKLNQRLEGVEKEMSQRSCGAVEEQYSQGREHSVETQRLVSEDSSHYILIKGSQKTVKAPESQPAAAPWSSGPWSRRGKPKGRPEPLWRPVSDDAHDPNYPVLPSSSSTTPKPTPTPTEQQLSDGAPPSPRTLQAIQAAMMDSSSEDEDEAVSRKAVQRSRTWGSQEENGGVSPRTLEAIQKAMMEEAGTGSTEDKTQQGQQRKYVILTSSDEDEGSSKKDVQRGRTTGSKDENGGMSPRTLEAIQKAMSEEAQDKTQQEKQRKYVILTSSDEDDDGEDHTLNGSSKTQEAGRGGGVSPQTLLAIQRSLGEDSSKLEEQLGHSTSSEEEEEMETVVGIRSKAFRSAVCGTKEKSGGLEEDARKSEPLSSDASKEKLKLGSQLDTTHIPHHTSLQDQEEKHHEEIKKFNADNMPSGVIISSEKKVEGNGQHVVKSEEENSSSEEDFIEVSEGEDGPELNDSVTKTEEQLPAVATELDVSKKDEDEEEEMSEEETKEEESSLEATTLPASSEWDNIDTEELVQLERDLQAEQSSLHEQQQQQQRSAATVTGQMCQESQELLRLFGVPFLVAPMEAEAQCAALDRTDQTHGTITDDSDVWLFGGRHVYKNFFSNNKYVEHYQYVDIQNQLGLDRTRLINLAYLLGSDYTEGIPGVGYVTGMEILNEFPGPGMEPLTQFSKWWTEAHENKKLRSNPKDTKVKKKLRNLKLHPGFPNPAVSQAYLQPAVDQSEGSFSWGRLQVDLIKEFCYSRFGWNSKKTEETLQPVLKQLNTQQTQLRIDSFFRLEQQEKQAIRSQRLRRAVTCLKRKEREGVEGEEGSDEDEDEEASPVKKGKKGKAREGAAEADVTPAVAFGGGFICSDTFTHSLEEPVREEEEEEEEELPENVGRLVEEKQPMASKSFSKGSKTESTSSSSSSEDERENSYGAAMITARSVFEGKMRGRGKRGGRGGRGGRAGQGGRGKAKKTT
uniref:Excision repair cross-complementation group 5 n=1 Tax=Astyanax mexicanus TaxID=7994 RepID=A0A8B9HTK3_ASTMX